MFYGTNPPKTECELPKAVAVCIMHGKRLLLLRRIASTAFGDTWQLPGGKVLPHEHPHDAAHREVWEETGITALIRAADAAGIAYLSLEQTGVFAYHLFRISVDYAPSIELDQKEHSEFRWFTPEEALESSELFPHTDDCIRMLFVG